ncbi:DUF6221 family protein [Streptomyces hygroscopicus]|uniref:DUF6221 family protein n=1 Tax=Streptomyces hygroscopicus TaxID=1912 RepID=UPI0033C426D4
MRDRVLADVKAKRRLVGWVYEPQQVTEDWGRSFVQGVFTESWMRLRKPVIYELVAAYADHPDFHPEWKLIAEEPAEDKIRNRDQTRTV